MNFLDKIMNFLWLMINHTVEYECALNVWIECFAHCDGFKSAALKEKNLQRLRRLHSEQIFCIAIIHA